MGESVVVRLGRALYWVGVFLAAVAIIVGCGGIFAELSRYHAKFADVVGIAVVSLVVASAFFGAGYGARYVLANEKGPIWPLTPR
jgi:hypothetical protein